MPATARAELTMDEYQAGLDRKFAPAVEPTDPSYPPSATLAERACRVCNCTDDDACPGGCYWVEDDLCSRCRPRAAA